MAGYIANAYKRTLDSWYYVMAADIYNVYWISKWYGIYIIVIDYERKGYDLGIESAVSVYGTIAPTPNGKNAPGGIEMAVEKIDVLGRAPTGDDAFTNILTKVRDYRGWY
jgi:hypothetical protein